MANLVQHLSCQPCVERMNTFISANELRFLFSVLIASIHFYQLKEELLEIGIGDGRVVSKQPQSEIYIKHYLAAPHTTSRCT